MKDISNIIGEIDKVDSPLSMAELIQTVLQAASQWADNNNSRKEIAATVTSILERQRRSAILAALGFEEDWNRLRVDHCNCRGSLCSELVTEEAAAAAKKFVKEHISELLQDSKCREDIGFAIEREFSDVYRRTLREELKKCAQERAVADATYIISTLGYNAEDIKEALKGIKTPEPKIRQRTWDVKGIISDVRFLGIVAVDAEGALLNTISAPNNRVFALIQVQCDLNQTSAQIISDGEEWHPIHPIVGVHNEAMDLGNSRVVDDFQLKGQKIFNLMNPEDKKRIFNAIGRRLSEANDATRR